MSMAPRKGRCGRLHHSLLSVGAWVLLLGVGFVYGVAPVYDVNAVRIVVANAFESPLRSYQIQACAAKGGVLVPDVSDAVHQELLDKMEAEGASSYYGYLGGSTLLSSTDCTTSSATLSCVWHWDQGRYDGAENAYPFYQGNYYPPSESKGGLSGAGMISTASANYWRQQNSAQAYPGSKHERYAMLVLPQAPSEAGWMDSSDTSFSYGKVPTNRYFMMCLVEMATTTTTTTTTTTKTQLPTTTETTMTPTDTTQPPDTNTDGESQKEGAPKRNANMWVGISILTLLAVSLALLVIIRKAQRKRWCCFADEEPAAAPSMASSVRSVKRSLSKRSRLSSDSRFSSGSSSCCSARSFHASAVNKNGGCRRSILQDGYQSMEDGVDHLDTFSNASSDSPELTEDLLSSRGEEMLPFQAFDPLHVSTVPVAVAHSSVNGEAVTRELSLRSLDENDMNTTPPRLRRTSSVSFIDQGNL
ncbi:hypothetical protein LSCM1_03408 [Leishmania martiniquensis]|uniref:Uncharacterized protein n=1 Tax=Leishmania martiniquensis TaxID=1580590 RepID=A0A836KLT2_9TRYP|nr:hypothetical protein LSCM1_03408 [Leishmania martiniquensis]